MVFSKLSHIALHPSIFANSSATIGDFSALLTELCLDGTSSGALSALVP